MQSNRWKEIDGLLQQCLDLDREGFVKLLGEVGQRDADLKAEVETLLAMDAEGWDFIESAALESAASFMADDQPRLAPGDRVAHYEIVELIGRGGMGEVYVAKDQILNRTVALKFLTSEYTGDKDRLLRFEREAQAASALNHPHILTIYQLGTVAGQQFIATELIEGETLRQRLARAPITLDEALDITIQVAGALAAAHRAGIIHRDIKPENIMLRPDGYIKVLDFGVAKLAAHSDYEKTTSGLPEKSDLSSGFLMGTVRYMSPEQASGWEVDARSDIFSLGVVLYEMLAGHSPFQGETPTEVMDSVLHHEPQSLAADPLNISERLARTVEKALRKDRENRYFDANEFVNDLKAAKHEVDRESKFSSPPPSTLPANPIRRIQTKQTLSSLALSTAYPIGFIKRHWTVFAVALVAVAIGAAVFLFRPPKQRPASLGTWLEKAPMPKPRAGAAVAALDGQLYVVSGADDSGTTDGVAVYDPTTDSWSTRTRIPTARFEGGAVGINGKLYVFGGCGRNSEGNHDCRVGTTNVLEVYDPRADTWATKAPMPTARSLMAAAVIGGKLYVTGGRGSCPPCPPYQALEIYDPVTDTWDTKGAPLPTAVVAAGGAALDGKFYVAGGAGGSSQPKTWNLFASYDPATNQWQLGPPLPTPRAELGLEAAHGLLYAIGGVAQQQSDVVEAFDPTQNTWSSKAPLPFPRIGVQPVAIDGVIYVGATGGRFNEPSTTLHAYTAVCPGSTCISSPANLISWWPGDGDVNDVRGRRHGKVQGDVTFETGKVGQAFNLDGSSFVTMGNPPGLNLSGSQITLSGWINPRINAPAIYFGKTQFGANDYLLMYGRGVDAMITVNNLEITALGYSDFPSQTRLYVPPTGQWTHIALTYDGTTAILYVNGKIVGEALCSGAISGRDVPFNIGGRADDQGTGKFNGLIDEVQVFNRALSADEIRTMFEAGSDGQCKPQARCR